jgi:hypothetical protein
VHPSYWYQLQEQEQEQPELEHQGCLLRLKLQLLWLPR